MRVEVVYARADRQRLVCLELPVGATAVEALRRSGLATEFPELDMADVKSGIFGRRVPLRQLLRDGDRVEIYRPLRTDPKSARRKRAREQERRHRQRG